MFQLKIPKRTQTGCYRAELILFKIPRKYKNLSALSCIAEIKLSYAAAGGKSRRLFQA